MIFKKKQRTENIWAMKKTVFLIIVLFAFCDNLVQSQQCNWPVITDETKPWTRWWWHGSAVNPADLTANMEDLQEAGFGGVEITPIYDVKGYEDKSLSFLSPEWMQMLDFTLKEGQRLGLGVDLANASGWPFGGPWIQDEDACKNVQYKHFQINGGESLSEKIVFAQKPLVRAVGKRVDISEVRFPISSNTNLQELALDQVRFEKELPLQALMAYSHSGEIIDLTVKVSDDGTLNWQAPAGSWDLYAVFQGWHGKMVERAGSGGEGNVIDHFSKQAAEKFLGVFDEAAKGFDVTSLRAFFNDSYEVDDAQGESNWTPLFFEEFQKRRGYDLKNYLPALFGNDTEEMNSRVRCDYRETISDLLLENFTVVWADWAKKYHAAIRNQAHGSPANILDLYAASDIPETEGTEPMRIKMATSAGHVSGKPLIACEAATWLDEHFQSNLSSVKQNFDRYLANGVNHIVYHGTPYSPKAEEWPGWMFYASVHFAPTNSWWDELKTVNEYVANCQSFMQNSTPRNDILLYFPIYDSWSEKGRSSLQHFGGSVENLTKNLSEMLLDKGYTFDYISDRQIQKLQSNNQLIKSAGGFYKTILVPECKNIPLETLQKLTELASQGANVIFEGNVPGDVPGLAGLEKRRDEFIALKRTITLKLESEFSVAKTRNGQILTGKNMEKMLAEVHIYPEELAELGLWFNRVKRSEGTCYFISNWSEKRIEQWVNLQSLGKEAVWFNPMNREMGKAQIQKVDHSRSKVYLQLSPGETLILQWFSNKLQLAAYPVWQIPEEKKKLTGEWSVSFVKGGPTLPETYQISELKSWTEQSDELKKFSGTASYRISFSKPKAKSPAFLLDLGKVCETATVFLNGEKIGTTVGPVYQFTIDASLLKKDNELEIRVSNLMANRMADMDKRGVDYKKFYNINFAARKRENTGPDGIFTAAYWGPAESGLIGPVTFTPMKMKNIQP